MISEIYRQDLEAGLKESGYDLRVGELREDNKSNTSFYPIFHHHMKRVEAVVDYQSLKDNSPILITDKRRSVGDGQVKVAGVVFPSTKIAVHFSNFIGGFPGQEFLERRGYRMSNSNGNVTSVRIREKLIDELTSRV